VSDRQGLSIVTAVLLAAGIALAGFFIGRGFERARSADRFVTVKGFAEREEAADLVIWPIPFTITANDLGTLQSRVDEAAAKIARFLSHDFTADEWSVSAPRVTDRVAQFVDQARPAERYVAEAAVTVRTGKIAAVRAAMQRSGELVKDGVAVVRSYEQNTEYMFTQLERIKPEMIGEATRDARRAAEQFASDSGSRVGAIRTAQQGLFSIENRDAFSPEFKKVRVVTTVQYFLLGN